MKIRLRLLRLRLILITEKKNNGVHASIGRFFSGLLSCRLDYKQFASVNMNVNVNVKVNVNVNANHLKATISYRWCGHRFEVDAFV